MVYNKTNVCEVKMHIIHILLMGSNWVLDKRNQKSWTNWVCSIHLFSPILVPPLIFVAPSHRGAHFSILPGSAVRVLLQIQALVAYSNYNLFFLCLCLFLCLYVYFLALHFFFFFKYRHHRPKKCFAYRAGLKTRLCL